tara:strand:+ start:4806 stop:5264 length:459 start_codon:yes stop_codon:yes gene_type:complete
MSMDSESTGWIYEPSDLQERFRLFVRDLVDDGVYLKKDWFKRSRKSGQFERSGVRISDWNRWSRDARFVAWFFEEFPEASPLSREEYALLDSLWASGVVEGMRGGEEWSYRLYAGVRFKGDRRAGDEEETAELRSYLNDTGGSRWRSPAAEA